VTGPRCFERSVAAVDVAAQAAAFLQADEQRAALFRHLDVFDKIVICADELFEGLTLSDFKVNGPPTLQALEPGDLLLTGHYILRAGDRLPARRSTSRHEAC